MKAKSLWSLVPLLLAVGCGGNSESSYVPDSSKARQALETALNAWQQGEPVKTIKTDDYSIDVFDARWQKKAKLESFEILSEGPSDPHPTFSVALTVNGKKGESEYRVVGIDPILIFRAEDYKKATGM
jgi:hypothetical protein